MYSNISPIGILPPAAGTGIGFVAMHDPLWGVWVVLALGLLLSLALMCVGFFRLLRGERQLRRHGKRAIPRPIFRDPSDTARSKRLRSGV